LFNSSEVALPDDYTDAPAHSPYGLKRSVDEELDQTLDDENDDIESEYSEGIKKRIENTEHQYDFNPNTPVRTKPPRRNYTLPILELIAAYATSGLYGGIYLFPSFCCYYLN
jgi:hypothetical protein